MHPQDLGTLLDLEGIAVRTGHHCAMPLHAREPVARVRKLLYDSDRRRLAAMRDLDAAAPHAIAYDLDGAADTIAAGPRGVLGAAG